MTIDAKTPINPSQLWAIAERGLFIVVRTDGPDSSYPIVLREVARHPKWTSYCEATVSGYANSETAESNALRAERWSSPTEMEQERAWFALPSVRQWHGTIDGWRAQS
jgi:hypothetical protein